MSEKGYALKRKSLPDATRCQFWLTCYANSVTSCYQYFVAK